MKQRSKLSTVPSHPSSYFEFDVHVTAHRGASSCQQTCITYTIAVCTVKTSDDV